MTALPDGAFEHLRAALAAPVEHPRYTLLAPLGHGGMGTVYRALDRELGREVAVKLLNVTALEPELHARMLREARVVALLEHPGIVPVHDAGLWPDGRPFYVMKLVRGRRLDECCTPDLSLDERLRIFERICETVSFAHAQGVIHRDLKPPNIMVGSFGEVLVLDWGVAKVLRPPGESTALASEPPSEPERQRGAGLSDPERHRGAGSSEPERKRGSPAPGPERQLAAAPRTTAHGTILGTPAYMPPEQARGDLAAVDERSDVYALGALLRFLVAGGAGPAASSGIPAALRAICAQALAAEPVHRYPSAAALAADIARFRQHQRVHAHHESVTARVRRLATRYRTPLLLVLAYLLMRALFVFWQPERKGSGPEQSGSEFPKRTESGVEQKGAGDDTPGNQAKGDRP